MSNPDRATFKSFNAETFDDAAAVACAAFHSKHMVRILRKILANPYAKENNESSFGDIAYVDGEPVGFQAIIPFRLYDGQTPIRATIGSSLGVVPGTSPVVLFDLIMRPFSAKRGSGFHFSNTANRNVVRLSRFTGVSENGGDSWKGYRYAVINPLQFISYVLWNKVLKRSFRGKIERIGRGVDFSISQGRIEIVRQIQIDKAAFDGFWNRYLQANKGIVSSRSAAEIEWMFGGGIDNGTDVLLSASSNGAMCGYVIVRSGDDRRWKVVDMIALHNDGSIIAALLTAAKHFLRRHSCAAMLRISGFPDFIQDVIATNFPHRRKGVHVPFIYEPYKIPKEDSWFFGPYDGDAAF